MSSFFIQDTSPFRGSANKITLLRIALVPVVFYLTVQSRASLSGAIVLCLIFLLDILDGFVARRTGTVSSLGGFLDIFADRTIEMIFWIYFVMKGCLPVFYPLILIVRIWLVDFARLSAAIQGQKQEPGSWLSGWRRNLVASTISKSGYNLLKMGTLLLLLMCVNSDFVLIDSFGLTIILSLLTGFSLLRGLPILTQYVQYASGASNIDRPHTSSAQLHLMYFILQLVSDTVYLTVLCTTIAIH